MGAVVAALVIAVVALSIRSWRSRPRSSSRVRTSLVAAIALVLVGWFAVDQLAVTSGRLADTLDRVYVVSAPDPQGPLGLLAAAELELDHSLRMTEEDRTRTDDQELVSYEVSDRLLGIAVGRACVVERSVELDGRTSRSYQVEPGGC